LSRVFWRPVAAAISQRQDAAQALIGAAKITQAKADAALAEVSQARAEIGSERAATLHAAKAEATIAAQAALAEARAEAEAILEAARTTLTHEAEAAHKSNADQAVDLSLQIAAQLLKRLQSPAVQTAFLSQLVDAIADMPAANRKALVDEPNGVEIVAAVDTGAQRERIEHSVRAALGGAPKIRFTTDPDLIAGLELRSPHFVLHNSWQADLEQVQKAVRNAA
jgi:F-type H+-transporting ATPase subunit b